MTTAAPDGIQDQSARGGRGIRWNAYLPLTRGIAAFLFIYGFYATASAGLVPIMLQQLGVDPRSASAQQPIRAGELSTAICWTALALLAGAVAIGVVVSSIIQLRRNLGWISFRASIAFLSAMSALAAALAFDNPIGILKLPQLLTCVDRPVISVDRPFGCGVQMSVSFGNFLDWQSQGWFGVILRIKLLLNILLLTAAVFVIGSMLIISSTSRMARRPARFYARMNRNAVLMHLFVAGAVTLSLTTFTDLLLANWPIQAIQTEPVAKRGEAELVDVMAAFTFFYAVLGSTVLGMALYFSREFSFRRVAILTPQGSTTLARIASGLSGAIFQDSTVKALAALSPILTVFVGHPIINALVEALSNAAP